MKFLSKYLKFIRVISHFCLVLKYLKANRFDVKMIKMNGK